MDTTGWQGQFAEGFKTSPGGGDLGFLFWFLLILAGLGVGWYVYEQYRRSAPRRKSQAKAPIRARFVPVPGRLNPLQQVRIQEMIDEFRKQEPLAQAVPSAVLEKYSEFFFNETGRLKTTDKEVEVFINQNYSLKVGDPVELDFQTSGSLHLIKSRVVSWGTKSIVVDYQNTVPDFIRPGTGLHINYSSGRHFLQGHTQVLDVQAGVGLVLRRPTQVILTSERRYSRLPLTKASGTLQDTKSDYHSAVKVLDLSLEGVRIQVGRPLDRSHIYLLTFEAQAQGRVWPFGPLECVPSKAFLTGSGTHESGLLFLTMTMATRQKVVTFMKSLAQDLQNPKPDESS